MGESDDSINRLATDAGRKSLLFFVFRRRPQNSNIFGFSFSAQERLFV